MRKTAILILLALATGRPEGRPLHTAPYAAHGLQAVPGDGQAVPRDVEWPMHGGVDNIRYSPLAQIDRSNVATLQVAWTYDSHDAFKGSEMQSNAVVVDGVLYATTPTLKVIALDAATGKPVWTFDPSGGASSGARFRHR